LFFLTIITFFILSISGLQLVAGGYVVAGVPALIISGIVPVFSSFWSKRRQRKQQHHDGSKKKSKWDICDCFDAADCGCGCD
jgi:hypothetical protein